MLIQQAGENINREKCTRGILATLLPLISSFFSILISLFAAPNRYI